MIHCLSFAPKKKLNAPHAVAHSRVDKFLHAFDQRRVLHGPTVTVIPARRE